VRSSVLGAAQEVPDEVAVRAVAVEVGARDRWGFGE
jgi:hypothetical protein